MVLRYYCTREPELFRRHRISSQPGDIIRCTATTVLDLRRGVLAVQFSYRAFMIVPERSALSEWG